MWQTPAAGSAAGQSLTTRERDSEHPFELRQTARLRQSVAEERRVLQAPNPALAALNLTVEGDVPMFRFWRANPFARVLAVVLGLLGPSLSSVQAANLTRYDDRAAFLADTSNRTQIDFDTLTSNGCLALPGSAGVTVSGVNFYGGVARQNANFLAVLCGVAFGQMGGG